MNNDIMNANLLTVGNGSILEPGTKDSGDTGSEFQRMIRPRTSVFQMPDGRSAVVDESGNILDVK